MCERSNGVFLSNEEVITMWVNKNDRIFKYCLSGVGDNRFSESAGEGGGDVFRSIGDTYMGITPRPQNAAMCPPHPHPPPPK